MPEQQLDEAYKSIEGVKALDSDPRHHLARLRQRPVAQVNAHLRTEAEETRYQVVGLENTVQMHLSHSDNAMRYSFNEMCCQNTAHTYW